MVFDQFVSWLTAEYLSVRGDYPHPHNPFPHDDVGLLYIVLLLPLPTRIMASALVIHLWLPLFAFSSLAVRFVYLLLRAAEWAEWFLKQGDAHPLKTIGIVATIIVFGSAMLVKEASTLL
jgi:hypothetical protein